MQNAYIVNSRRAPTPRVMYVNKTRPVCANRNQVLLKCEKLLSRIRPFQRIHIRLSPVVCVHSAVEGPGACMR